jgi:putative exporter of polyketide antibiotics
MACACGWFAASISLFLVESRFGARVIAAIGAIVALLLVAMKVIPKFPGHFSLAEWVALAIWLLIGIAMHLGRAGHPSKVS